MKLRRFTDDGIAAVRETLPKIEETDDGGEAADDVICIPASELQNGDEILGMKIENMVWMLVVKRTAKGSGGSDGE